MAKRRPRGTGQIYQHNGWWVLRFREQLVEDGQTVTRQRAKQLMRILPEHGRSKRPPKEVDDEAKRILKPFASDNYTPEGSRTLEAFVEEIYFPMIEQQKRASTIAGYKARWESQLKARCGKCRLREFRTPDGQKLLAEIARQNPNLRKSTMQHLRSLLSGLFRFAIQQGYIEGPNPMREVGLPRAPESEETCAYSLEEIDAMLSVLPQPAFTLVAVAAFTGLRRAELRGLEWQDYDGDQISVRQSIWESHVNEPKTRKSKAPVPVIPKLARILDHYREQCGNPRNGPMFANGKGHPENLNNTLHRSILPALNRCAICKEARAAHIAATVSHEFQRDDNLPVWHGWHGFRRGLATNLYQLGVPDKVIQQILRHSNVSTTMNIYVKTVSADSTAAMQKLDAALCADSALASLPPVSRLTN